jgi:hypothetical protein
MNSIAHGSRFILISRIAIVGCVVMGLGFANGRSALGQAFRLDQSGVPQQFRQYFDEVEQSLNQRIQDYSNELPVALLYELNKLYITARVVPAPAGILGFAGPTATVSIQVGDIFRQKTFVVPVTGQITINLNEIDFMLEENQLIPTIEHEILHAFGFGSLWTQNRLIAPLNGVGATQYVGGKYAIQEFRKETNRPYAAFVPIMQFGGPGTALSHWADDDPFFGQTFTPAFKKEIMTGFACDLRPGTEDEFVCPPVFFSMTTEGALADLGYAMYKINPNRTPPPTGIAGRNWPKIVGDRRDPFAGPGGAGSTGNLSFKLTNIVKVYRANSKVADGIDTEEPIIKAGDPFNLRDHNWAK